MDSNEQLATPGTIAGENRMSGNLDSDDLVKSHDISSNYDKSQLVDVSESEANGVEVIDPEFTSEGDGPINEETQKNYRIWKKNAPFLYDYLTTTSLLWPSLTIQFFPDLVSEEDIDYQRLVHGTFTLGQSIDTISILQLPRFKDLNKNIKINKLDYNADKQELELATSSNHKLKVLQKINHLGDVNKVRYMPQKPNVLASGNNLGDLVIYERTKHSNFRNTIIDDTSINKPQLVLKGHSHDSDIFAIDWNKQKEGCILSGNMAGDINLFDIRDLYISKQSIVSQVQYFDNGGVGINDIEWFLDHDSLFSTVDDGGVLKIFDTRQGTVVSEQTISNSLNSVSINPGNSTCLAVGDSQGVIEILDFRSLNSPVYSIRNQHTDSITQLKWNPKLHNILGSSSTDKLVRIFDISKSEVDSGLVFVHAGHMLGVNDFDWSYHDEWVVASVADDNSLHVWKPAYNMIKRSED